MPNPHVLRAQRDRLAAEVLEHKAEIRRRKSRLQVAASALESITKLLAETDTTEQPAPIGAEGDDLHGHPRS